MSRCVLAPLVTLLACLSAQAKITNPVTLEQVVADQPLIFTAKVVEFLPDKPGMVFAPSEVLRGEFAFDRVPVNLTGDKEAKDEKQPALLLERLDKDLPLVIFASSRGKTYSAVAYSNGTWFRMEGTVQMEDGKKVTRWKFTHCEPYFRRTFKGTTEELIQAVRNGLKGGKLPAYNEKEEPGYGPPHKKPGKEDKKPLACRERTTIRLQGEPSGVTDRHADTAAGSRPLWIGSPLAASESAENGRGPAVGAAQVARSIRERTRFCRPCLDASPAPLHLGFSSRAAGLEMRAMTVLSTLLRNGEGGADSRRARAASNVPAKVDNSGAGLPLAVIQLPFLGLIAALAALFPAVFGGMALLMRRWVAALSTAGLISLVAAVFYYLPHWIAWSGLTTVGRLWGGAAILSALMAVWAAWRYRRASASGKGADFQPRYGDRIGLAVLFVVLAGVLAYPVLTGETVRETPWLELVLMLVPTAACLFYLVSSWWQTRGQEPAPVAVSAETVGLWAGGFACAMAAALLGHRGGEVVAVATASGGGIELADQPLWIFEPKAKGEIGSTPCVDGDRVYVAVHHRAGFTNSGRLYCLDAKTGAVVWEFDDEGSMKPVFCSPTVADGRVYIGEGYHTNQDSRMFCIDAATGQKVWEFATESHTESSPVVADGKVVFGAGDDGLYCVDAKTGQKVWQYTIAGGLHVDSNPAVREGRVYAASGTSRRSKNNRAFCLDLATGNEVWSERTEYSCWGSPAVSGSYVLFPTGNGTFSEDREPVAGLLLCRDAVTGKKFWDRAFANAIVCKPAADRYQVYVGTREGNIYGLDRHTGEVIWSHALQGPVLASPAVSVNPRTGIGEVLYAIGDTGIFEAVAPLEGRAYWAMNVRALVAAPHATTVSTPVIVRDDGDGRVQRRVYLGVGFGPSKRATPTARLYCFVDRSKSGE